MRLLLPLLLVASVAWADTSSAVVVSDTTPTKVPATTCGTCKSLMLENGGSNSIYCAPSSTVTSDTGFEVEAGAWRAFPNVPVWCVAATAAQSGTGRDHTLVWVSDQ